MHLLLERRGALRESLTDNPSWILVPAIGAALALALRAGRRQRLVDTLPTYKTMGIFIGLVELKGTAEVEQRRR